MHVSNLKHILLIVGLSLFSVFTLNLSHLSIAGSMTMVGIAEHFNAAQCQKHL